MSNWHKRVTRFAMLTTHLRQDGLVSVCPGGYVRRVQPGKEPRLASTGILLLVPAFIIMAFSHSALGIYTALTLFSFGK